MSASKNGWGHDDEIARVHGHAQSNEDVVREVGESRKVSAFRILGPRSSNLRRPRQWPRTSQGDFARLANRSLTGKEQQLTTEVSRMRLVCGATPLLGSAYKDLAWLSLRSLMISCVSITFKMDAQQKRVFSETSGVSASKNGWGHDDEIALRRDNSFINNEGSPNSPLPP